MIEADPALLCVGSAIYGLLTARAYVVQRRWNDARQNPLPWVVLVCTSLMWPFVALVEGLVLVLCDTPPDGFVRESRREP